MATSKGGHASLVDADRLCARLVELVRTPSLGGDEEPAIQRIAQWLSEAGAEVDLWHDDQSALQVMPGYPGHEVARATVPVVAARVRGARPGPAVLLTGHVDVVPPGDLTAWTRDPYSGVVQDGLVHGRGACDMKSGLLAALEVVEAFARGDRDFPGQIIFVAVPGEEDGGVGTFSAIRRGWRADVAMIPEPTSVDGRPSLVVAHAGCMIVNLCVPGRSAHASTRLLGESALEHYLVLHEAMRREEKRLNDAEDDPLLRAHDIPYATNVGIISGGAFSSSVMDSLSVDVRIGVALGETVDEAEARFRRVIAEAAASDPWLRDNPPTVTFTCRGFGSARTRDDHPLIAAVTQASQEVAGRPAVSRGMPYGCDMAGWVRLAGVPTVLYGPGDIHTAHAADEHVSLEETTVVARVLTQATERLLEADLPGAQGGQAVVPSA